MKRVILFASIIALFLLGGCGQNINQEDASVNNNEQAHAPAELLKLIDGVFSELGIKTYAETGYEYFESSGSGAATVYFDAEGLKLQARTLYVDGTWHMVFVSNSQKQYFWVRESAKKYCDIYDWKTGKLVSAKTEELPSHEESMEEMREEAEKIR